MELYSRQQNWTNGTDNTDSIPAERVAQIVGWVTFAVGLPAISLAIYMLSRLVKGGNGTPVQAINLLISDIFNLFSRPQITSGDTNALPGTDIPSLIFYFGVASNVVFMVGVAQERHLLVANEQCHGCCRKAKQSSLISLATWAAPIGIVLLLYFGFHLAFSICLLVPFPLLVFFLLDSCRASLCCPTSVRPSQRRRVLAMLVTILLDYSILFLPFALTILLAALQIPITGFEYFGLAANVLLYVSPVINPFISMLLTRNFRELLDTLRCCCCRRKQTDPPTSPYVIENPNIALPLSDSENSASLASEYYPKGMAMSTPNGISTVYENFNSTRGMPGQSNEIPTVSGGLLALPHMGMTCSQAPTPFGNLTTIPSQSNNLAIPGLPNMGSGGDNLSIPGLPNMGIGGQSNNLSIPGLPNMGIGGQSNNLSIPGLPNMGTMGIGSPFSSGSQSNNLTMPGMPNMGLFPTEGLGPSSPQETTMSGVQNTGLFYNQSRISAANLTQDTPMPQDNQSSNPGLQNVGVNYSQVSTPAGNLTRDGQVLFLPVVGLTCCLTPVQLGNLSRDATMMGLPVLGLIYSQVPAPIGNQTSDLTLTDNSDQEESCITKL